MSAPVQVGPSPSGGGPVPSLTPHQREYLERLARGETAQQIAKDWHYEQSGSRSIATRIRKKLGAKTNTHAVFIAVQLKILDPSRRHGDHAGFAAHRYYGEEPCKACWEGERAYRRDRRAARKANAA